MDDFRLGDVRLTGNYTLFSMPINVKKEHRYKIKIEFDSDGLDQDRNDRDVFIKSIALKPGYIEGSLVNFALEDFSVPLKTGKSTGEPGLHLFANGTVVSKNKIVLKEGIYSLILAAKGTHANDNFPDLKVFVNNSIIKKVQLSKDYSVFSIPFITLKDGAYRFKIVFDSDSVDENGNDRDVFIQTISLKKGLSQTSSISNSELTTDGSDVPVKGNVKASQFIRLANNGDIIIVQENAVQKSKYQMAVKPAGTLLDVLPLKNFKKPCYERNSAGRIAIQ